MKRIPFGSNPNGTFDNLVGGHRVCWALSDEYHANEGGHVRIYRGAELRDRLATAGLRPAGRHHAHALHAPYWWLKCAVGVRRDTAADSRACEKFD